ncbi:hypothetical protein POTOM_006916 [Populus tomentosa]|uniref:Flavin-containing monooxygenase n=1 Tax=Populus tomentosa TaxID=118781 RepID=A0A8X8APR4_POPTO|nr:hypothetical protein POTOM_006916 [Populus tomentosa]
MFQTSGPDLDFFARRCTWVNGPVIVGAGPSGLAVGSGLRGQGVPFVMLERASCIASLWQNRTYDRLKLHIPKQFCQLPSFQFPEDFPEYPTKYQFINYLESYAKHFNINPRVNETVQSAKWLVVATGENYAEKFLPEFEGLQDLGGRVMHACEYKSGESYRGERVLASWWLRQFRHGGLS